MFANSPNYLARFLFQSPPTTPKLRLSASAKPLVDLQAFGLPVSLRFGSGSEPIPGVRTPPYVSLGHYGPPSGVLRSLGRRTPVSVWGGNLRFPPRPPFPFAGIPGSDVPPSEASRASGPSGLSGRKGGLLAPPTPTARASPWTRPRLPPRSIVSTHLRPSRPSVRSPPGSARPRLHPTSGFRQATGLRPADSVGGRRTGWSLDSAHSPLLRRGFDSLRSRPSCTLASLAPDVLCWHAYVSPVPHSGPSRLILRLEGPS